MNNGAWIVRLSAGKNERARERPSRTGERKWSQRNKNMKLVARLTLCLYDVTAAADDHSYG